MSYTFCKEITTPLLMPFVRLVFVLLIAGCHSPKIESSRGAALDSSSPRLIRITREAHYSISNPGSHFIAELRGDTPETRRLIDELWSKHHASFPPNERLNFGFDAAYTQIEFVHGSERMILGSWHTTERTSPKVFASHTGLTTLGDRTREQALADEPESYLRFRKSFDSIFDTVIKMKTQNKS